MTTNHFFIVGAQRSGTTYLYQLLDEHPQIEMARPLRPEPKFFMQSDLESLQPKDYEERYFSTDVAQVIRGEKSTSYIESEIAAQNIASWYPDAKIVFLLRNPIARALSNYQFSRENGIETESLEVAFFKEEKRRTNYDTSRFSVSPYAYLKRGQYIDYINMYNQYFPQENILIYLFEELIGNATLLQSLYFHLGVDTDFVPPSLSKQYNMSEPVGTELSPKLKTYLKNYFRQSIHDLENYLGRSINIWEK